MRHDAMAREGRGSALWGTGGRGSDGRGRSRLLHAAAVLAVAVTAVLLPATAAAAGGKPQPAVGWFSTKTYEPGTLLARAQAQPRAQFRVIVETENKRLQRLLSLFSRSNGKHGRDFVSIPAINAKLPGWAVLALAENAAKFGDTTVTEDIPVKVSGYSSTELWTQAADVARLWSHDAVTCPTDPATGLQVDPTCTPAPALVYPKAPAIAIVDSGLDASLAEFSGRTITRVALASDAPGAVDDGRGHGTFVASIAASASPVLTGVAPTSDLVSIRVMDDEGVARTSDVIAAADWILQNKDAYGIRVANFSLHAAKPSSFRFDPLDHAVERLWLNGVVVVAASGNFGDGTAQKMAYAPGNDPFVITVGATDVGGTASVADDAVAPWSAYGHTLDGFAKPEIVAPGRYMVAAVPAAATLKRDKPLNVRAETLIQLSGTSFAAPVVAGAAAQILAVHPEWTPDQVKGALMLTARRLQNAPTLAQGFGTVDVAAAAALTSAPNPNAGLLRYVVPSDTEAGGLAFDAVSWADAARSDVSWADVSWADVSWADVSWADVSWADVSWADVSWSDVSWADVSWADVSWADVSWESVSWADSAEADAALADVSWSDVSWADNAAGE